ncbi:transcriptional regulator XRE family with cupin sensor [Patulibacter medicamentivorans]|jgi:transcriptional regulator with XRE-family HTH domain|uniref:Transcriptional regulator XRE family with cupin sensor n=1 Tax=Patulibacter medicamentivorans TaxID=1097667 RepID=H0E6H9_9ACTN|nr:XRE family transcriptional regulator [Patulibacter medicamentivorans]EHN10720.1 transcriptional regulator XRE family with cupin sensor [Patulibacter medicamentivorans]
MAERTTTAPTTTADAGLTEQVGARLRARRVAKGLSARQLAEAIGVSPSMVSMIENGRTNPSVGTLLAIVGVLDTSLDALFSPTAEETALAPPRTTSGDGPVLRAGDRPTIELASGVHWERLTPTEEGGVSFMHVRYDVGGASCPPDALLRHPGRDYVVLIEGRLGVKVGFEDYELHPGDSIVFDATTPHRLWTIGDQPAIAVVVVIGRSGEPSPA